MSDLKVGVFADGFRLGSKEGILKAAEVGAAGVQIRTTKAEFAPEELSARGRKELVRLVESCGLVISATCADYGGGFVDVERNRELVPLVVANIELARDLGVGIITTHIGVVPEDDTDPVWSVLLSALEEVGRHAENCGVVLATETGPESGIVLARLLGKLQTGGIRVNFDPANLVSKEFDYLQAVDDLAPYIVHTHAKDSVRGGAEVPLGSGDVDFPRYVARLQRIGYNGFYTVERECGEDPETDIREAVAFLRSLTVPPISGAGAEQ